MTNTPLRQAFWVRDGMESSRLQEPAATIETQTPSYIPKELWSAQPREQSRCGDKNFMGESDPFIKMDINSLTPNSIQVRA